MIDGFLTLHGLSDDERAGLAAMQARLDAVAKPNRDKQAYYEAEQVLTHMGIAIPPEVANRIKPVIGWGGTVIDVPEERLNFLGWNGVGVDKYGLDGIFDDNTLDVDSALSHLDALLYGTSFIRVGTGAAGEPDVVVTMHSPMDTTGVWDTRSRRMVAALSLQGSLGAVMDTPTETITLERKSKDAPWVVVDRDKHGRGQVPVARMVNRPRSAAMEGRSELSRAVRYYCDAAVRTLLGMEGNREFYSIPQLVLLGRGSDAFTDSSGNPTSGWRVLAGHALAIDKDEQGDTPSVEQLTVGSPQPSLDQVRGWAQLLSAESGIPASYLGLLTDNPPSADAIRAGEARLVRRAERRQKAFGRAWMEVARLALLWRDGTVPDDLNRTVSPEWGDASTPTRAATADEVTKYVAAGVLPPDSPVTWRRMGLSRAEQAQLAADPAPTPTPEPIPAQLP